jgi:hypothetical protein
VWGFTLSVQLNHCFCIQAKVVNEVDAGRDRATPARYADAKLCIR